MKYQEVFKFFLRKKMTLEYLVLVNGNKISFLPQFNFLTLLKGMLPSLPLGK